MSFSSAETEILSRFAERCRTAGGVRAGYGLRRDAVAAGVPSSGEALDAAFGALVDKGVLVANEAGDRFFLTESGSATVEGL